MDVLFGGFLGFFFNDGSFFFNTGCGSCLLLVDLLVVPGSGSSRGHADSDGHGHSIGPFLLACDAHVDLLVVGSGGYGYGFFLKRDFQIVGQGNRFRANNMNDVTLR